MQTSNSRDVRALLREKGQQAWVELTLRYGKTFRHGPAVVTCEPEAVRALLMERVHAETRPSIYKLLAKIPGANGVLFMDGEPWLTRTRALTPVFQQRNVETYGSSLRETTLTHLADWRRRGRVPDLPDAVQQLGAASVLRMGYGVDPGDPLAVALGRALVRYKQHTMRPQARYRLDEFSAGGTKILDLPWVAAGFIDYMRDMRAVRRALDAILAAGRVRSERPGWIAQLSDAGLSAGELALEVNHLYGAFNAIDYVVAAALLELARDHTLAAALRAEIQAAIGDREPVVRQDLPRLPLTNGFMLEVLRRYPVTMGAVRVTGAPMTLAGETVPAGTTAIILLHALHHHPDFWDSPNTFEPGRWIASPSPRVPFSYVPFLDGSRKCSGRSMAEFQLLTVVTTILRRVDLCVDGEAVVPPFMIPRFAPSIPFELRPAGTV